MMRAWFVAGLLLSVGCKKPPSTPAEAKRAPMPSDVKPPAPPPSSPLAAQLEHERNNRPTDTVPAEKVFASVESAGIKLRAQPKQVLGVMMKAHYCELAMTPEGLGMSVCEFDDDASMTYGREHSQEAFKAMPNREFLGNGKTLLTVNRTVITDATTAQRDKVVALFPTLAAK